MKRYLLIALAALLTCGAIGAYGAATDNGILPGDLFGSKSALTKTGALKARSVGHRNLKNHIVSCEKLSYNVLRSLPECNGGVYPSLPTNGRDGQPGEAGQPGLNGNTGDAGTKGDTGATGPVGPRGPRGHRGRNGRNGYNGHTGATGPKGATGADGPQGVAGTPGKDGADGKDGTSAPGIVVTHVTGGDSSVCGADWANDDYTRTLQFVPQSDGSITVIRTYDGTFTTIAGAPEPNGPCNTSQAGGVTGTFTGFDVVSVTGGYFNPSATCADPCTGAAMVAAFFPGGTLNGPVNGWEYHYTSGADTWVNADAVARGGNTGNITNG